MANKRESLVKPYYSGRGVTIYHADCRDILPNLSPVQLVVTDPPYNAGKDYDGYSDSLSPQMYRQIMKNIVAACRLLSVNQAWIAPRYQLHFWLGLFPKAHLIVIRRGAAGPYRGGWSDQFEIALAEGKPSKPIPDIWNDIRLKGEGYFFREKSYGHPGYTPIMILGRFIEYLSFEGDTILDPFAGTGTAGVAARAFGRKAILIEQSERYCEIAADRIRNALI